MSGSEKFANTVQLILNEMISQKWMEVKSFEVTIHLKTQLKLKVEKRNTLLNVSLLAKDLYEDPVVTFKVNKISNPYLRYYSIKYLNGVTLKFRSTKNVGNLNPNDLDRYFSNWTQLLLNQ